MPVGLETNIRHDKVLRIGLISAVLNLIVRNMQHKIINLPKVVIERRNGSEKRTPGEQEQKFKKAPLEGNASLRKGATIGQSPVP